MARCCEHGGADVYAGGGEASAGEFDGDASGSAPGVEDGIRGGVEGLDEVGFWVGVHGVVVGSPRDFHHKDVLFWNRKERKTPHLFSISWCAFGGV